MSNVLLFFFISSLFNFFIISSVISCDNSILSYTSLASFANLSNVFMLISDDTLTFLWLVTNDVELTASVEPFLAVEKFLEK